jgi:hypothetical protein
MITGPGYPGDRLDAPRHVALFRMLAELPPSWVPRDRGAPRLPFYLARGLTPPSADRLLARAEALGLQGRIEGRALLGPLEMRRKAGQLGGRSLAVFGTSWSVAQLFNLGLGASSSAGAAILLGVPLMLTSVSFGASVRRALRPVVRGPRGAATPDIRLGHLLSRLVHRQDRRLLARISERLDQLPAPLDGTALGARAAELGEGLVALDRADAAMAGTGLGAEAAQGELRRVERGRVLVRAELLRVVTRLEAAVMAALRASAIEAARELAGAAGGLDELALGAEAERDLAVFLTAARGRGR